MKLSACIGSYIGWEAPVGKQEPSQSEVGGTGYYHHRQVNFEYSVCKACCIGHLAAFRIQFGPEVVILTHVANNLQTVLQKVAPDDHSPIVLLHCSAISFCRWCCMIARLHAPVALAACTALSAGMRRQ